MAKLLEHIENLRVRVAQIADEEFQLLRALRDALSRVDEQLLLDVRAVSAEHEARRGAILSELQTLASRMGAFPVPREPLPAIEGGAQPQPVSHNGNGAPHIRGDWRQAARNVENDLDFDLDFAVNGRPSH